MHRILTRHPKAVSSTVGAAALATAGLYYYISTSSSTFSSSTKFSKFPAMSLPSYTATFSVPLEYPLPHQKRNRSPRLPNQKVTKSPNPTGISSTSFSLPSHLVTITSTSPPSHLISAIQSTGRDAILRGSGAPNTAAVCILETLPPLTLSSSQADTTTTTSSSSSSSSTTSPVRGLARLIQLSPSLTLLDLTVTHLVPGTYRATLRRTGDITRGSASLGDVYSGTEGERNGVLGSLVVDDKGRGALVGEVGWRVWEVVGRGMCVERLSDDEMDEGKKEEVVGVVARSAGVWENEKVVCGCSGKTVWEEREEMVGRGML
ncbi:MAG: hypothetical protein LQ351_005560 [Letrouitia transgressa]|nr:MAG: hypothetical protein LQ351_005560 [Letrouitia transgressa]